MLGAFQLIDNRSDSLAKGRGPYRRPSAAKDETMTIALIVAWSAVAMAYIIAGADGKRRNL